MLPTPDQSFAKSEDFNHLKNGYFLALSPAIAYTVRASLKQFAFVIIGQESGLLEYLNLPDLLYQ